MGFFSWNTQDTDKSISNAYSSKTTFKVIMTDDKGNQWMECDYEGYGVFGGKDYHALVDEMNGGNGDRSRGIDLYFDADSHKYKFPSLSEDGKYYGTKPQDCEFQGYFYPEDDEQHFSLEEEWDNITRIEEGLDHKG